MPQIYLCFLWHMHQPFYKDLFSGEYRLPWTRMHGLKDYYGMVRLLDEFPDVRQTFNLVPSMMVQLQEYAAGTAVDPFLQIALKPASDLTPEDQAFLLRNSFHANEERLIDRYPRYGELYDTWQACNHDVERARRSFGVQAFRDLQVLSQLAWFDEEFLEHDEAVQALVRKGRGYNLMDQVTMGQKQREILSLILPTYKRLAQSGQIEISTTPYYHPILPLLCDSNAGAVSSPGLPLPARFRYPCDARRQLDMSYEYVAREMGIQPAGLWPSEGSVSDEALALASGAGFRWAATDNGVLGRTLNADPNPSVSYKPFEWRQQGRSIRMIFRDHLLSDLIGFVYSKMDARAAASDFLGRIDDNCRPILASGRDALVPIILDGENAWEFYHENGRPFLRELYGAIQRHHQMSVVTVSEALKRMPAEPLNRVFPGSWISANFNVWIGAEEDNRAWEYLLRARRMFDEVTTSNHHLSQEQTQLAYEELLIAEGSDWCWWYGPEHQSAHRAEFDQLFRDHLANVYRALNMAPPEELSRAIIREPMRFSVIPPSGLIRPTIDGDITSYFEWLGAGLCEAELKSGAMHGQRHFVRETAFGSDGENLYLRIEFVKGVDVQSGGLEIRINVLNPSNPERAQSWSVDFALGSARIHSASGHTGDCAFQRFLEIALPLGAVGAEDGSARFQFSVWSHDLPMDSVPGQGWIEFSTSDPQTWEN